MTPISACVLTPLSAGRVWSLGDPAGTAAGIADAAEKARTQARDLVGVYGKLENMVRGSDLDIAVSPVLGRIVIAIRQRDEQHHPAVAIEFCAILAAQCATDLLTRPAPADLFRGAIAYGPGDMADGRLLGPVFEDAEECASRTAAAILWLAPSALAVYASGSIASTMLGDCDVPLSGGATLPSKAVRLRLDAAATTAFGERAGTLPGLDGAVSRAHSLRHLAWLGARR